VRPGQRYEVKEWFDTVIPVWDVVDTEHINHRPVVPRLTDRVEAYVVAARMNREVEAEEAELASARGV
jgi:hypothetical protein